MKMKNATAILKSINEKKTSTKKNQKYVPSAFLRTVHNTEEDFKNTARLFDTAQQNLFDVSFNDKIFSSKLLIIAAVSMNNTETNLDEVSEHMKQIATESELRGCGKKFFENFALDDSPARA
jgi:hypothetical protein